VQTAFALQAEETRRLDVAGSASERVVCQSPIET